MPTPAALLSQILTQISGSRILTTGYILDDNGHPRRRIQTNGNHFNADNILEIKNISYMVISDPYYFGHCSGSGAKVTEQFMPGQVICPYNQP